MARRPITWTRIRDPFYGSLGASIIVVQIINGQWNPLACAVALAFCGLPGVIALNEWGGRARNGSDSTPPSSDSSSAPPPLSSSSGPSGGDRRDETA